MEVSILESPDNGIEIEIAFTFRVTVFIVTVDYKESITVSQFFLNGFQASFQRLLVDVEGVD